MDLQAVGKAVQGVMHIPWFQTHPEGVVESHSTIIVARQTSWTPVECMPGLSW